VSFAAKQRQRLCSPDTISQIHHPRLSRATPPAQARIVRPAPGAGETSPQVRAPPARTPAETLTSGELFTVRLYGCARLRRAPRQRRSLAANCSLFGSTGARASGAHASSAHPGRDAPAPQGLPRAQGGLSPHERSHARRRIMSDVFSYRPTCMSVAARGARW